MSNSKLIELSYYDPSAQVRLSAYADTLVLDHDQNGSIISAIRFGGYPEMVRAMADAIYGGATIEAAQNDTTRMLQSSLKSYQRQITHDGIYAVATLMAADTVQEDDRSGKHEKDEDTNLVDTEQMELQPRRCYIFCPARDQKRLFEELDHKTAAPLIPEFQDYVLSSLRQRGDLRQLEVISLKERIDAWVLDLKPQDQNVVEVLERGLQSGDIQIPGAVPNMPDGFENVENVTGYLNVTINRAEMLSAIKRASAIAPADSPLDVLRGVLLEADAAAGKLTVTSTNLEAALEEKLPCTVQEDGALVFGAKMLAEMLSRLPQDTVQLCRAENQGRMTLRSGDACYEVDVWERGAFPKPDLPFPEDTVKLSGIPAMAQHTVFATAQDNSKPLLKCVNLMFTSTGLRAAGSNGNCIVTARGDNQSTGDVSLLIPAASLGKLSNMCQDKDEFRVGTTGKSIVFFRENFLFSARLMEGGYIDTDQLVGSIRNAFTVLTDIHDMRAALSSVLSIGTGNRVKLSFQDQRLVFQCAGDCVSASAPIEVIALTGTPAGDYWFNAKQLVTCLKALSGTVTLGIAQGGMLTLATQDAYYLQNAMRPEAQKKTQKAAQPAAAKAA